jgi:cytochrome c5
MGEHDDKTFMKRFSGVIVGLVIVTIVIIVIAVRQDGGDTDANPSKATIAAERVAPVGDVRTELPAEDAAPTTAANEATADEEADAGAEPEAAAEDGEESADIDGGAIYAQACQVCHMSGAAGAPIPGSEAWAERAKKGVDALTASAISGIGAMPPKGGRMDLSDAEIRASVQHMLDQ